MSLYTEKFMVLIIMAQTKHVGNGLRQMVYNKYQSFQWKNSKDEEWVWSFLALPPPHHLCSLLHSFLEQPHSPTHLPCILGALFLQQLMAASMCRGASRAGLGSSSSFCSCLGRSPSSLPGPKVKMQSIVMFSHPTESVLHIIRYSNTCAQKHARREPSDRLMHSFSKHVVSP